MPIRDEQRARFCVGNPSGRLREVDFLGLAGAVEAAEFGLEGGGAAIGVEAADVTRGEGVGETVAFAVLRFGAVEVVDALEEALAEESARGGVENGGLEREEDELVDFGLELELEEGGGEAGADAFGEVDEVADAFECLEEAVGIVVFGGVRVEQAARELEGELEDVVLFADEKDFAVGVVDFLDEVEDVEVLVEGVEALELALNAAEEGAALGVGGKAQ